MADIRRLFLHLFLQVMLTNMLLNSNCHWKRNNYESAQAPLSLLSSLKPFKVFADTDTDTLTGQYDPITFAK